MNLKDRAIREHADEVVRKMKMVKNTHQKISWTQIRDDQGNYWKVELSVDSTDLLHSLGRKAIRNASHKAREVSGAVLVTAELIKP